MALFLLSEIPVAPQENSERKDSFWEPKTLCGSMLLREAQHHKFTNPVKSVFLMAFLH